MNSCFQEENLKKLPIVFLFMVSFLQYVHATILHEMDEKELVMQSDVIVHGTVDSITYFQNDSHSKAFTRIQIIPGQCFYYGSGKSECKEKNFSVIIPGGRLSEKYDQVVIGVPEFEKNEEVVVYLKKNSSDFLLTGFSYGKWSVIKEKDASGKEIRTAQRDLSPISLAKKGTLNKGDKSRIPFEKLIISIENLCTHTEKGK
jgi:hypothetical protein